MLMFYHLGVGLRKEPVDNVTVSSAYLYDMKKGGTALINVLLQDVFILWREL